MRTLLGLLALADIQPERDYSLERTVSGVSVRGGPHHRLLLSVAGHERQLEVDHVAADEPRGDGAHLRRGAVRTQRGPPMLAEEIGGTVSENDGDDPIDVERRSVWS